MPPKASVTAPALPEPQSARGRKVDAMVPSPLAALVTRVTQRELVIIDHAEIAAFNRIVNDLAPRCTDPELPQEVCAAWEHCFASTPVGSDMLYVQRVPPVTDFIRDYSEKVKYSDHPTVGAILSRLENMSELSGSSQNLAKIVFGYFIQIMMRICDMNVSRDAILQRRLLQHLHGILQYLFQNEIKTLFSEQTQNNLKLIYDTLDRSLADSKSICEIQEVPQAVASLCEGTRNIASNLFYLGLGLFFGGNTREIPYDYRDASRFLEAVSPQHPARELFLHVAHFLPLLHSTAERQYPLDSLDSLVRPIDEFQALFTRAAGKAKVQIGPIDLRFPEVSHLVLKRPGTNSQALAVWVEPSDTQCIQQYATLSRDFCIWLEFWLWIAHMADYVNTNLAVRGQITIAQGPEADFFQRFVTNVGTYLELFDAAMATLESTLRQNLDARRSGYEHKTFLKISNVRDLASNTHKHGIAPLRNFRGIVAKLIGVTQRIRLEMVEQVEAALTTRGFFGDRDGLVTGRENSILNPPRLHTLNSDRVKILDDDSDNNSTQVALRQKQRIVPPTASAVAVTTTHQPLVDRSPSDIKVPPANSQSEINKITTQTTHVPPRSQRTSYLPSYPKSNDQPAKLWPKLLTTTLIASLILGMLAGISIIPGIVFLSIGVAFILALTAASTLVAGGILTTVVYAQENETLSRLPKSKDAPSYGLKPTFDQKKPIVPVTMVPTASSSIDAFSALSGHSDDNAMNPAMLPDTTTMVTISPSPISPPPETSPPPPPRFDPQNRAKLVQKLAKQMKFEFKTEMDFWIREAMFPGHIHKWADAPLTNLANREKVDLETVIRKHPQELALLALNQAIDTHNNGPEKGAVKAYILNHHDCPEELKPPAASAAATPK